ncbi:hypothetical protein ACSFBI_31460 [Variovorax sp. RB3P1]|uniref:hypothetical protein n=1 Tax=Variovorax sp. RB3P1 TaxID=3443732 RepID=UPI003F458AFB
MSENIASFDDFETDTQIAAHQRGLVRIVLEGETDVMLFRRYWFSHRQDVFEFIEAGAVSAGPGCTGVADGVARCAQQGIPAVGIVDRDTLFRDKNWDLLFNLDAAALNPDPIAAGVYVASRWEVEAYLLEADHRLSDWVSAEHRRPPGPEQLCQAALTIVLQTCDTLLSAASFFAANHEQGKPVGAGMFCDRSPLQIQAVCDEHLAACLPNARQVIAKVDTLVSAIRQGQPASEADRLPFLLQYIDTKRLFKRLLHTLEVRENVWFLATLMKRAHLRPQELDRFLSRVETQLAN